MDAALATLSQGAPGGKAAVPQQELSRPQMFPQLLQQHQFLNMF
jgi:hypothetical protein